MPRFPLDSVERVGNWVSINEHCGDPSTFKILTTDTHKVIPRSSYRCVDVQDPYRRYPQGYPAIHASQCYQSQHTEFHDGMANPKNDAKLTYMGCALLFGILFQV